MIGLLVAVLALIPFAAKDDLAKVDANRLPCYPDTVEVIEQQIVGCDTTYTINGLPYVTCRVILCAPLGVDLNEGRGGK